MGVIYMHQLKDDFLQQSSTNGRYVGKTIYSNPKRRWMNGNGYLYFERDKKLKLHQYSFGRAILKYGWESFDHIILEEVENENLDEAEIYWIEKMESFTRGYNESTGGGGSLHFEHSIDTKLKLKEIARIRCASEDYVNPNKGNLWSEEQRRAASIRVKNFYKENPETIKKISNAKKIYYQEHPEIKEKMSLSRKGKTVSEDEKKRLKNIAKEYFSDPKNLEKHGDYIRKYYNEHPEARKKRSKYMTGRKMPESGKIKQSEKQKRKVLHIDNLGNETVYQSRKEASNKLGFSNVSRWYANALSTGEKIDGKKMRSDSKGKRFDGHIFRYLNETKKYGGEPYLKGGEQNAENN